jgi:hypothetical protein
MKSLAGLLIAAIATAQAQNADQRPCPTFTPGQPYPWEARNVMKGDQWADVYLFIDKKGRAKDCRLGGGTIRDKNTRWYICSSFKKSWYTKPILKDGLPVEGWFKRRFIMTNGRHMDTDAEARKRFFQEHPEERPECYPEYR